MTKTLIFDTVSTKLRRIAQLAKEDPGRSFLSLAHHIDGAFLREAYRLTRKDGAVGVDGQTSDEYAANLDSNLVDLLNRFKSGTYVAPSVRRVHIPKGDGKTRPLGIPTFEDKILQRAVAMVLGAVYEQDFLPCSHGFRPKRSAHGALRGLRETLMEMKGGWLLDVDFRAFFDTLDHGQLRTILDHRVRDGVLRRMIDKWLKAGILEKGELRYPEEGTPQGGVISPLLANIYLHTVLDTWFERDVRPVMRGRAFMIRYADDFVMGFQHEKDARRVQEVLSKRVERFGLTLHPEKTRLLPFCRPAADAAPSPSSTPPEPGTFDFLGFTHLWAQSRNGFWVIKRQTARRRLVRALKAVSQWCRHNYHRSTTDQQAILASKLRGHYQYYGVCGNFAALARFRWCVERLWRRWLSRRSQRGSLNWVRFKALLARHPLPAPRTYPIVT